MLLRLEGLRLLGAAVGLGAALLLSLLVLVLQLPLPPVAVNRSKLL